MQLAPVPLEWKISPVMQFSESYYLHIQPYDIPVRIILICVVRTRGIE